MGVAEGGGHAVNYQSVVNDRWLTVRLTASQALIFCFGWQLDRA